MDFPGYELHELKGDMAGMWAVSVNGNWRFTFRFVAQDAEEVDLQDYHLAPSSTSPKEWVHMIQYNASHPGEIVREHMS